MSEIPFIKFLRQGISRGGFEIEDALAAVLPLMREVASIHETGHVAPLRGITRLILHDDRALGLATQESQQPRRNPEKIDELQMPVSRGLDVIGEARRELDEEQCIQKVTNLDVASSADEITRPVYLPGYVSWEYLVDHHDQLTDIHSLGMILASLVCGLDFSDHDELELFANSRSNLFRLASRMHPVIAVVIQQMTELNRRKRAQDLVSLISTLETYRDQPVDLDMNELPGLAGATKGGRRKIIQTHLRDRLFEVSRRNRLLYFKSSQSTLNLTTASVPLVLDYRNVRPEQLLFWHEELAGELSAGRALPLQKWLRFEEAPYLPGQLDKLISDARRSRAEYGFSQLRLVVAFLRWNNLKESPKERIHSPLLLMPVELVKRKGVKDHYVLEPQGTEVEINPALRHHLKQLYNLDLPEAIDLRETSLRDLHAKLSGMIQSTEPGVTLSLTDKPKIQLIHQRARQRLDQYRRRMAQRGRKARVSRERVDYSYDREDFRPLGLQLFQKKILPAPLPLRELAGLPPMARIPFMVPPQAEEVVDHKMFALVEEAEGNPYAWEFDVCSLTLANFNYRKMTLVRDYANLIDHDTASVAFDRVFSIDPKTVESEPPAILSPSGQNLIIAADATQVGAIAKARQGDSMIIQGPPGTGKSQTITNLIADYVARGKRVLFVCEKRAAIDVVFHRLRQQGLDELCCLIHDSQADKKEFIQNLKQTYEQWLADGGLQGDSMSKRGNALHSLEKELAALQAYVEKMSSEPSEAGTSIRGMVRRLIELRGTYDGSVCPEISAEEEEILPHYEEWLRHGDAVIRLGEALGDLGESPVFAQHPLRWLGNAVITSDAPLEGLMIRLGEAECQLDDLEDALRQTGLPMEHWDTLGEVEQLLVFSQRLVPLAEAGLLELLDRNSNTARNFIRLCADLDEKRKLLEAAQKKTAHWKDKLPADETRNAMAIASQVEGAIGFLKPAWWRLRKVLKARYDFEQHAVKPTWVQVLTDLAAEYAAEQEMESVRAKCASDFSCRDPETLRADIALLSGGDRPPAVEALRQSLLLSESGGRLVMELAALAPRFQRVKQEVGVLLERADAHGIAELAAMVREIREEIDSLPPLLPALRDLAATSERIGRSLRMLPLTAEQFEAACARKTLECLYREDRTLQRFDSHLLQQKLDRLARAHRQWLESNAGWIRSQVRKNFLEHVQISNQSATVLAPEQKLFKKSYSSGRRELEHEFGKSMRYKSIRDLAAGETGQVLRDLKPIWLMSPLSVSDTLPLDVGLFDVVIFDEASQIPVEDAIPAAYRAPQVIVVGDEMQLPPTSFFSSSSEGDDELTVEEEGEPVQVMMDADSFLTQCARNLPSTLLAWHYRSRYESLISFSNAAFYGGELYTIPDRQVVVRDSSDMLVAQPDDASGLVPALLSRPISFIRCENSTYENRRNATEAAVVARLVRGILLAETGMSIGVAAFSEAQQGEIELALDALASGDPDFAARLEAEYTREEDDQFCGLFVKNLENVQGDERDVILMSVCYGHDAKGQMRMNFGPINQRGGEKRLNVIFSRARQHMAIVSSIRHHHITNDYNDGAHALKDFLHYAESLSRGDTTMARHVLEGLNPMKRKVLSSSSGMSAIATQLVEALQRRGWVADRDTGQSRFRCDVAVRAVGETHHKLAILLDDGHHASPLEHFHTRPGILRAFGWQVAAVTAKDWWHEPEAVLDRIERQLRNEAHETESEGESVPEASAMVEDVVTAPEATVSTVPDSFQRFECHEGTARKFWEIGQNGSDLTIRFGRIGTKGQTQVKSMTDEGRARRECDKLIAEKRKKGYEPMN